jgi:2-aminoadipate transaminase
MSESLATIQMIQREGIIDLSWGHPAPELLPNQLIADATARMLAKTSFHALTYGADQGAGPLLEWVRQRIASREGREIAPNQILTTSGNSEALNLICSLWLQPNDIVLVESPSYHLAVRIFRDYPLTLIGVPADKNGLQIDALQSILMDLHRQNRKPSMLYLVPTFNNPTGASLSLERRKVLVELASAEQFLIIEDDVYRELAYDGPALPSLWCLAPSDCVIRLGSFSKTLAPGMRLGWMSAPEPIAQRIIDCGMRDSGGGPSHFSAMVMAELCQSGDYDRHVAALCQAYPVQRDALHAAIDEYLPAGTRTIKPKGGYFSWVELPEQYVVRDILPRAEAAGVSFLPGERFVQHQSGPSNTLRFAFSFYQPAVLREGVQRLASVL